MLVRHNTQYLEEALRQIAERAGLPALKAQSEAMETRARAVGFRRLATAGAIAIAALGIGLAIYFARVRDAASVSRVDSESPAPSHIADRQSHPNETPIKPVTTEPARVPERNYVKFINSQILFQNENWTISTGHLFAAETDYTWSTAWCYSERTVQGVKIKLDLLERASPSARPLALVAPVETLIQAGLDRPAAVALATECVWLDGRKFASNDFALATPAVAAPIRAEVPQPAITSPPVDLQSAVPPARIIDLAPRQADPTASGLY